VFQADTREAQELLRQEIARHSGKPLPFPDTEVDRPITARLADMVRLMPDHVMARSERKRLTYRELDLASNRVANALLRRSGPVPGAVGLLMPHDVEMLSALAGVLKAGKFYVPLDPSYPLDRLRFIVQDASMRTVVAAREYLSFARALLGDGVEVLVFEDLLQHEDDRAPGVPVTPDHYSYLLYTSGSTGAPKGVIENHRDVMNFARVFTQMDAVAPGDVISGFWSFSFSGMASTTYLCLLSGATALLAEPARVGMRRIGELMREHRVSILTGTPALFRAIVEADNVKDGFPVLRVVRFGASAASGKDIETARQNLNPGCYVRHSLGMSELKHISSYIFGPGSALPGASVPLGYVSEGVEVLLLDESGKAVGPGEVGEMVVRSRFVCPGYWNRPDLNAARISGDPNGGPNRFFKTGDVGMRDARGCLYHKGRKDFQVKVRGYRVEVEEVEAQVRVLPGVMDAAVRAWQGSDGETYLAAYVRPASAVVSMKSLRSALSAKLPSYMVPSVFMEIAELPLTATGKVDRNALPEPHASVASGPLAVELGPAASDVERKVAALWADVLDTTAFGVDDRFLDMGGDSLKAARLLTRIEKQFAVTLPLVEFFDASTVSSQAALVSRLLTAATHQQ
jgi:amino acid adenylation domain-containing protein